MKNECKTDGCHHPQYLAKLCKDCYRDEFNKNSRKMKKRFNENEDI